MQCGQKLKKKKKKMKEMRPVNSGTIVQMTCYKLQSSLWPWLWDLVLSTILYFLSYALFLGKEFKFYRIDRDGI